MIYPNSERFIPIFKTQEVVDNSLTFTAKSASNILLSSVGSPSAITLQYNKNNTGWTDYTVGDQIDLNTGEFVKFSGANDHFSSSGVKYYKFVMTGTIEANGNIQSLTNFSDTVYSNSFVRLFYKCTSLTKPPKLLGTTLSDSCYLNLFEQCSNLTTTPALPATTLANSCYSRMFQDCSALITAPTLPATTLTDSCYRGMFAGCTSLTAAPELPATTLAEGCYYDMFSNCSSLSTAPVLPATTLANYCYLNMFGNCTNLTAAPSLPATTLTDSCYQYMFQKCTSLSIAPALPATSLTSSCYRNMFSGCTSLVTPPTILPATNLIDNCYNSMFRDCTSLTAAPELPATGIAFNCYAYMFQNCTSLGSAPVLPAATLANYCYQQMFYGCSNLTSISADFTSWHSNATTNWVNGVASNGTFTCPYALSTEFGVSRIPTNWTVDKGDLPLTETPLTFKSTGNTTIELQPSGNTTLQYFYYKKNNGSWLDYNALATKAISLTNNETLAFKTTANKTHSDIKYYHFITTGDGTLDVYGNIKSINNNLSTVSNYNYNNLFKDCTKIVDASNLVLPATTLAEGCYSQMFQGCTSLTSAPELPATTLAYYCYYYMFKGCTSLTTAPNLPATTITYSCYDSMFANCTSLTSISVNFTAWSPYDATLGWVLNVASNGTFTCPAGLDTTTRNMSRVPANWTVNN